MNTIESTKSERADLLADVPEWFDPALLDLLNRKRHRKRWGLYFFDTLVLWLMELLVRPNGWSYVKPITWSDLEAMMEQDCQCIQSSGFAPNLIIGVKSGGAFIANFIAKRLGIPNVQYVHVTYYSPIFGSTVLAFITRFLRKPRFRIERPIDVEGKRVLLVDDQIYTGRTLRAASDWLVQNGVHEIKTYCLYASREETDFCYRRGRMNYVPWGDDP